jgi:hypothetical protein
VILRPGVLSLLLASAIVVGLLAYAARWGLAIARRWDLTSGSAAQLALERRTSLVSVLVAWVMALELVSLFLLVYTADGLAPLFTGAMCAAGSLQANEHGYPALLLKLLAFVLAGLWLVVNHVDRQAEDYPLVRTTYRLLLAVAPVLLAGSWLQARYFLELRPEVITSCCGSLFGREGGGIGSDLAALPARPTAVAFVATLAGTVAAGAVAWRWGRGGWLLGALSALALPVSIVALVSVLSPYLYELPTHHCPFCLLQREYGWVGYPFYATLLGGSVAGMGAGVLGFFRSVPSLAVPLPRLRRRLAAAATVLLALFGLLAAWGVAASDLRM